MWSRNQHDSRTDKLDKSRGSLFHYCGSLALLSTAVKEIDTFEKGHSREVKLTDQILKIVKRVTEKLTRQ